MHRFTTLLQVAPQTEPGYNDRMPDAGTPGGESAAELAVRLARVRQQTADRHPPGFYEQVTEWLQHPDAAVREEAVRFLGRHFRERSDGQVLLEMVMADPSPEVRKWSAKCLGGVFRSTCIRQVTQVLAAASNNPDEDGEVRAAAYAAIRRINGY